MIEASDGQPRVSDEHYKPSRVAPWLITSYEAPIWTVSDTGDSTRTAILDFRVTMPDGRTLIEHKEFYRSTKEYAFRIRDPRFSRIDDAQTHVTSVRNLIYIAHRLCYDGLTSFSQAQPFDIDQIVECVHLGIGGVVKADERIERYVNEDIRNRGVSPPLTKKESLRYFSEVRRNCGLPDNIKRTKRAAFSIRRAVSINPEVTDTFNEAEEPSISAESIRRWLEPLEFLYNMRHHVEADTITFRPFSKGASAIARRVGSMSKRTPTVPPRIALHLLERASRQIIHHKYEKETYTEHLKVFDIAIACWIVIAAFSARRKSEIYDLRDDCIYGDDKGGWSLHIYIAKTLKRREWVPIPNMVARAIKILRAISFDARIATGTDHLFQWQSPDGTIIKLDVTSHLDRFAAKVKVPLYTPKMGEPIKWHFSPHQFRRFFAILYFYRFDGATIETLSHHLRHFNVEQTRRYVMEDPELAAIWLDVEWGYKGEFARSIVAGERSVAGAAGNKLKKTARLHIDKFRKLLWVVSVDRISASVRLVMERGGLVLTPTPWVTCTCPRTAAAASRAACRGNGSGDRGAVGPNFASAGPAVCGKCPHAVLEATKAEFVEDEIIVREASIRSTAREGSIFALFEAEHLVRLRGVSTAHFDTAPVSITPLKE